MKRKMITVGNYLLAFMIPMLLVAIAWWLNGIYLGSKLSVLASDSFTQTVNFYDTFHDVLHGQASWFYTWTGGLGVNFLGIYSYYLGGVVTPLVYFFAKSNMASAVYCLTLLKFGLAGLSAYWYAINTFEIKKWQNHLLALGYSLMAFGLAFAEQPMWLDTLYILPIIILGIDRIINKRPGHLLLWGYFLMFITNFYMAYIVGIFSFLYWLAALYINGKFKQLHIWVTYLKQLGLALGMSAFITIPTALALKNARIPLSQPSGFFTNNTGIWDLVVKSMVGTYDTTKFGTIPFISIGLLPLILAISFFVLKSISIKTKITMAALMGGICLGFYIQVFDLAWQGGHFPAMFLFRYSLLFSFMIFKLAGVAWSQQPTPKTLEIITLSLGGIVAIAYFGTFGHYRYVNVWNLLATLLILAIYLVVWALSETTSHRLRQSLVVVLLVTFCVEMTGNAYGIFWGTKKEWHYPSLSLYTQNYASLAKITNRYRDSKQPLRMESLDPISRNDGFNYGYSSVNIFSSMRNRPFMQQMDKWGYRSTGDNLSMAYVNNTLLMDSILGNKVVVAKGQISRYGYKKQTSVKPYNVYKNQNALSFGTVANDQILKFKLAKSDNLGSQTRLLNELSSSKQHYFKAKNLILLPHNSMVTSINGNILQVNAAADNEVQQLRWQVTVPAHQQVYLSLFPLSGSNLGGLNTEVKVDQKPIKITSHNSQTGQYIDLGYYKKRTNIKISTNIWGSKQFSMIKPNIVLLDTHKYQQSMDKVRANDAKLSINSDTATGTVKANKDHQALFTSIPYDVGWRAMINDKTVKVNKAADSFVGLKLSRGTNKIKLFYRPDGWYVGLIISIVSLVLLIVLMIIQRRNHAKV